MRTLPRRQVSPALAGGLVAAALLAGCSGGSADASPSVSASSSSGLFELPPPSALPPLTTAPAPDDPADQSALAAGATCAQVRAGVAAFNRDDYEETVARFEAAVPLARRQAAALQTPEAAALLDAVTYYAELAPEDYREAFASSPQFARNQQITLGLCGDAEPAPSTSSSASPTERGIEA